MSLAHRLHHHHSWKIQSAQKYHRFWTLNYQCLKAIALAVEEPVHKLRQQWCHPKNQALGFFPLYFEHLWLAIQRQSDLLNATRRSLSFE